MVERWSSKPFMWVRFLLSLIPYVVLKNQKIHTKKLKLFSQTRKAYTAPILDSKVTSIGTPKLLFKPTQPLLPIKSPLHNFYNFFIIKKYYILYFLYNYKLLPNKYSSLTKSEEVLIIHPKLLKMPLYKSSHEYTITNANDGSVTWPLRKEPLPALGLSFLGDYWSIKNYTLNYIWFGNLKGKTTFSGRVNKHFILPRTDNVDYFSTKVIKSVPNSYRYNIIKSNFTSHDPDNKLYNSKSISLSLNSLFFNNQRTVMSVKIHYKLFKKLLPTPWTTKTLNLYSKLVPIEDKLSYTSLRLKYLLKFKIKLTELSGHQLKTHKIKSIKLRSKKALNYSLKTKFRSQSRKARKREFKNSMPYKLKLTLAYQKEVINRNINSAISNINYLTYPVNIINKYHTNKYTILNTFIYPRNHKTSNQKIINKLTESGNNKLKFNKNFYNKFLLNPLYYKKLLVLHQQHFSNETFILDYTNLLKLGFENKQLLNKLNMTNIIPSPVFSFKKVKKAFTSRVLQRLLYPVERWLSVLHIRSLEHIFGQQILFQFNPFLEKYIDKDFKMRYDFWLNRMTYYEKRLGHRFFLDEAIHIMHLGFYYKDSQIVSRWLKAIILRISFWKTRFIFRFIRYIFLNFFNPIFKDLKIKGIKIKLKGKISVAGNSRKRTILFRSGKNSYSTVDLKVLYTSDTVETFTGVMGFQFWIFY